MVAFPRKPRSTAKKPTPATVPAREVRRSVRLGPSPAAPHNRKPILHVYVGKSTTPLRGTPEAVEVRACRQALDNHATGDSVCLNMAIDGVESLLSVTVSDALLLAMQIRKCGDELTAGDNA
jgi:hypothetical protein